MLRASGLFCVLGGGVEKSTRHHHLHPQPPTSQHTHTKIHITLQAHEKLIAELKAHKAEQKAAVKALQEDKAKLERAFKEKVLEVKEKVRGEIVDCVVYPSVCVCLHIHTRTTPRRTYQPNANKQYVEVLEKLKRSGEELSARNRYLEARLEHDREAQKREERLLMAAVYEVSPCPLVGTFRRCRTICALPDPPRNPTSKQTTKRRRAST